MPERDCRGRFTKRPVYPVGHPALYDVESRVASWALYALASVVIVVVLILTAYAAHHHG